MIPKVEVMKEWMKELEFVDQTETGDIDVDVFHELELIKTSHVSQPGGCSLKWSSSSSQRLS